MMGILMKQDRNKKILLLIITIILLVLGIYWSSYLEDRSKNIIVENEEGITWQLTSDRSINLEIADTPQERFQGLSNRNELCPDCGMLFVFQELSDQSFVMRNMQFPLDILFIRDNRIVKVYENLPPEGNAPSIIYSSGEPVNYVLELNAGRASELGLRQGIDINLPIEELE